MSDHEDNNADPADAEAVPTFADLQASVTSREGVNFDCPANGLEGYSGQCWAVTDPPIADFSKSVPIIGNFNVIGV